MRQGRQASQGAASAEAEEERGRGVLAGAPHARAGRGATYVHVGRPGDNARGEGLLGPLEVLGRLGSGRAVQAAEAECVGPDERHG